MSYFTCGLVKVLVSLNKEVWAIISVVFIKEFPVVTKIFRDFMLTSKYARELLREKYTINHLW